MHLLIKENYLPRAENAGLFCAPGYGKHPERKLRSFEIILMRSGTLIMEEDGVVFELKPNDALILLANKTHKGISEYDKTVSFYWIHFYINRGKYILSNNYISRVGYYLVKQQTHLNQPTRVIELFRQFLHGQDEGFSVQMEADLLVSQMLIELSKQSKAIPVTKSAERLAYKIKEIIDSKFYEHNLSTNTIGEILDLNNDYIERIFKSVYNKTIMEYVRFRRMQEAKKLLLEGKLNVNQVALTVGFSDPGYFRKTFKNLFDLTPTEFQKLYFRIHINVR